MEKNKKVCFTAFNYRFHPNLIKIKELIDSGEIGKVLFARIQVGQYLPDWHPDKDYRTEYSAHKDLGGGVLLTLAHEIDYAYWLFGEVESAIGYVEKLSSLEIDTEDTVAILLKTKSKAIIELHLDYIQRPAARTSEIIGEKGKIVWDYFENEVRLFQTEWKSFKENSFQRNDMYMAEIKHFLRCIEGKEKPQITNKQVKDVMKIITAVRKSSNEGRKINIKEIK